MYQTVSNWISGSEVQSAIFNVLGPPTSISTCFPSGWNSYTSVTYSPGICPAGYTVAAVSSIATDTNSGTETIATCCPTGFSTNVNIGQSSAAAQYYTSFACTSVFTDTFLSRVTYYSSGTSVSIVALSSGPNFPGVNAYGVQVYLAANTSSATVIPQTATVTATSSASLSSGAWAGIGIGFAILALGCIILGVLLFLHRQRKWAPMQPTKSVEPQPDEPESRQDDVYNLSGTAELDAGGTLQDSQSALQMQLLDVPGAATPEAPYQTARLSPRNVAFAVARPGAPQLDAHELSTSISEEQQALSVGRVGQADNAEEIQEMLNRAKEERESLGRIVQLRRLEEQLQSRLASQRESVNGEGSSAPV